MKKNLSRLLALCLALCLALAIPLGRVSAAEPELSTEGATSFVFSEDGITAQDGLYTAYQIKGTALTIQGAGTYLVSGSCSDGSIKIKKGTTGVTLILSGLDLTSQTTAPIACNKSTGVTLVAAAGTVNTLADTSANNDETNPDNADAENAVLKCKDGSQVLLCGTGELTIRANGKNGIKSGATTEEEGEASLTIRDLTLTIEAPVNDGINAEQSLSIESGRLSIAAADDGIHSDLSLKIGAADSEDPIIDITKCYEGLEAADLLIESGRITVRSTDDCLNAANSDLSDYAFSLVIRGGSLDLFTTEGDGIDSNGDLTISGGVVVVWSKNRADNQPLDADGTITLSGGVVLAGGTSAMGVRLVAEQPTVIFGSSQGGQPGEAGGDPPAGGPGEMGGTPPAGNPGEAGGTPPAGGPGEAGGDPPTGTPGEMGGDPPTGNPGEAGGDPPTGGPGEAGGDPPTGGPGTGESALTLPAGSTFAIQNAAGETLYEGTVPCEAVYLLYSAPELEAGETYTLLLNGEAAVSALSVTGESNGRPSGQTVKNANTATGAGIWLWAGIGVCAALSLPAVLLLRRRDRRENRG